MYRLIRALLRWPRGPFFSTGAAATVILGGAIPLGLLGVLAGYSLIYNRGPYLVRIIVLY